MAILAEVKDPRIRDVTVTYVEVSPDLRHAKVHVSVMGDDAKQRLSLRGLKSAAGFLQSKLSKRIDTRYTPRIEFLLDQGVKKSIEVARILKEVLPADAGQPADADAEEAAEEVPSDASGRQAGAEAPAKPLPGPDLSPAQQTGSPGDPPEPAP